MIHSLLRCRLAVIAAASVAVHAEPSEPVTAGSSSADAQIAVLRTEVNRLKSIVPDQSHAMADVGYHFANLWFAAEKKNWPLARFYLDETRSHLKWAVRIIPVRKSPAGLDVDLKGILDALDNTMFAEIQKTIDHKDSEKFVTLYKQTLEGCYACHKASGKPCLRPQIPAVSPQPIINFDPDAKWPQ
jgi:hypothetical protein